MFCSHDFNILLHGVGSKIELLEAFCRQQIRDFNHLVVNGFFPSLTIKSVSDVTRIRGVFFCTCSVDLCFSTQIGIVYKHLKTHVKRFIFYQCMFMVFFARK